MYISKTQSKVEKMLKIVALELVAAMFLLFKIIAFELVAGTCLHYDESTCDWPSAL